MKEIIAELGLVKLLVIIFVILGAFSPSWKPICIPIILLVVIRFVPASLTAYLTEVIRGEKKGAVTDIVSLVLGCAITLATGGLIYILLR